MHVIVSSCANHISRYICRQKHSKTGMTVVRGAKIFKSRELMNGRVSTMDLTPKKLLNSDTNSFTCSDAVTSKQRVCVFKSGNKGTSSVDLHRLINKALDIDVNVNWNSDIAVCITTVFMLRDFGKKKNIHGNVSKISVSLVCYWQIGSKSTDHSQIAWRSGEDRCVTTLITAAKETTLQR